MAAFVDTVAFYAMMDLDDEFHKESKITFSKLIDEREIFHSTNYVILETIFEVMRTLGLKKVFAFDKHFCEYGFQVL
ncbi:MAG: hypothetical protein M1371_05200 [Actinobacteria bacterium]|nr:hypothetical protein [Actinomycetota bacterium]